MQCFRTAQLYFSELFNSFDIFAISEHCLFEEQLEILEASINYTYKSTAVSAEDNPSILSGKAAYGGVALFWKNCIKDIVTPLENIDSDRIVGIRCNFNDNSPLFILSVYLPAVSHPIEEFNEYLDYLWALYDSLSKTGFMIVMGDFNGNLGNSLGERGLYAPNDRGVKLLDFANYFNLCPTNLLSTCRGPLETFVSHCGRFKSTIDYIFLPNCLFDSIVSSKVFEQTIDNTSDHLPVKLEINYSVNSCAALSVVNSSNTGVRDKIRWSKFTMENILTSYASPITEELNNMNLADYNSLTNSAEQIKNFMLKHSPPLVTPGRNNKISKKVFFRLPDDVNSGMLQGKDAFDSWKQLNFPLEDDVHETYRATRKEYRQKLRSFLDQTEADRIRKLCHAAESNEKLFWKLVKSQCSSSQKSAFLVTGDLLTDKKAIRAMCSNHFEALGTPSEIATFDKGFFTKVTDSVREVFSTFVNDPNGILCEPWEYEEVARVCSTLKLGVSGVEIDYEHIRYAGPPLWKLFFQLYQNYFDNFSICDSLLTGVILPLFKGKGAKANNKDNYRGITLFPTLCKIFEMVLLKRLLNKWGSSQICNLGSKKGLVARKPHLLF